MKLAWIVSGSVAGAIHAWLLFAIHPETAARPHFFADDSGSVELSVIESAPVDVSASEPAVAEAPTPSEPPPPVPPDPAATPSVPAPQPPPELAREALPPPPEPALTAPEHPNSTPPPKRVAVPTSRSSPGQGSASSPSPNRANRRPAGRGTAGGPTSTARYRSNPRPDYPAEARRLGQQGTAVFSVEVTADGRAGSVRIAKSSGFPPLDAAALQSVRNWTFDPARSAGFPVVSRVEVPVEFKLRAR